MGLAGKFPKLNAIDMQKKSISAKGQTFLLSLWKIASLDIHPTLMHSLQALPTHRA